MVSMCTRIVAAALLDYKNVRLAIIGTECLTVVSAQRNFLIQREAFPATDITVCCFTDRTDLKKNKDIRGVISSINSAHLL